MNTQKNAPGNVWTSSTWGIYDSPRTRGGQQRQGSSGEPRSSSTSAGEDQGDSASPRSKRIRIAENSNTTNSNSMGGETGIRTRRSRHQHRHEPQRVRTVPLQLVTAVYTTSIIILCCTGLLLLVWWLGWVEHVSPIAVKDPTIIHEYVEAMHAGEGMLISNDLCYGLTGLSQDMPPSSLNSPQQQNWNEVLWSLEDVMSTIPMSHLLNSFSINCFEQNKTIVVRPMGAQQCTAPVIFSECGSTATNQPCSFKTLLSTPKLVSPLIMDAVHGPKYDVALVDHLLAEENTPFPKPLITACGISSHEKYPWLIMSSVATAERNTVTKENNTIAKLVVSMSPTMPFDDPIGVSMFLLTDGAFVLSSAPSSIVSSYTYTLDIASPTAQLPHGCVRANPSKAMCLYDTDTFPHKGLKALTASRIIAEASTLGQNEMRHLEFRGTLVSYEATMRREAEDGLIFVTVSTTNQFNSRIFVYLAAVLIVLCISVQQYVVWLSIRQLSDLIHVLSRFNLMKSATDDDDVILVGLERKQGRAGAKAAPGSPMYLGPDAVDFSGMNIPGAGNTAEDDAASPTTTSLLIAGGKQSDKYAFQEVVTMENAFKDLVISVRTSTEYVSHTVKAGLEARVAAASSSSSPPAPGTSAAKRAGHRHGSGKAGGGMRGEHGAGATRGGTGGGRGGASGDTTQLVSPQSPRGIKGHHAIKGAGALALPRSPTGSSGGGFGGSSSGGSDMNTGSVARTKDVRRRHEAKQQRQQQKKHGSTSDNTNTTTSTDHHHSEDEDEDEDVTSLGDASDSHRRTDENNLMNLLTHTSNFYNCRFTALCVHASLSIPQLYDLLFPLVMDVVGEFGGVITKISHMSIVATFNAYRHCPMHEHVASLCATRIVHYAKKISQLRRLVTVALDASYGYVSVVGSEQQKHIIATGNCIELVEKLPHLARYHLDARIVASEAVASMSQFKNITIDAVHPSFATVGALSEGITDFVQICEILNKQRSDKLQHEQLTIHKGFYDMLHGRYKDAADLWESTIASEQQQQQQEQQHHEDGSSTGTSMLAKQSKRLLLICRNALKWNYHIPYERREIPPWELLETISSRQQQQQQGNQQQSTQQKVHAMLDAASTTGRLIAVCGGTPPTSAGKEGIPSIFTVVDTSGVNQPIAQRQGGVGDLSTSVFEDPPLDFFPADLEYRDGDE